MRALLVDLNNFARYPTLAVGALVAVLRRDGIEVDVLSPLALGVPGVPREPQARPFGRLDHFARHASAHAASPMLRSARARAAALRHPLARGSGRRVLAQLERALERRYDAVLVSTYLLYRDAVARIAVRCARAGIPVAVGGAYFAQPEVVDAWRSLPGVTAVFGGEGEPVVTRLVRTLAAGGDPAAIPGVSTSRTRTAAAPPLAALDALPFPDYRDFPWRRYPNRLVPLLSGRGCGWGACSFCSDVTSSMGRSFRTRSAASVLAEMTEQSARHDTALFVFTDLKLNSHLPTWHALVEGARRAVPGCQWIGAVHAGARGDHGLGCETLKAAAAAGMVRLTTGLESGSQRILDRMDKGTELGVTERMLEHAAEAGISVRVTMIVGHPGEEPEDVARSAAFLGRNAARIDRVLLNRFALVEGTRLHRRLRRGLPERGVLADLSRDDASAAVAHRYVPAARREWRRALWRLLGAVHAINRRPLGLPARAFEGVM